MKNKLRIVLYKKEKPATILTDFLPLVFLYSTAQNETRTHTPLPELGPEPSASTNSAIWANLKKMVTCIEIMCQARLALEGQSYYTFLYD